MEQITPCWMRGGRIEEIVWIGKEVLAWCVGLYIVFLHVAKKRQTTRWCWNQATGDGAHCIAGHVSSPIFAFSERSLHPRILIHAYPSMTRVSECCAQGCAGYLAIAFTAQDHLVSLGSHPNFPLIVWRWRTGERIAIVDTPIRDEVGQTIRITPMGRTVIGQVGKTCGRLLTWELDVVDKIVILKDHEITLPRDDATIHGISWCTTPSDPVLAITDLHGHVYLSNHDGTDVQRVVFSQRCWVCAYVELPAVCWFREGIVLRTTFCQIRYFKRDPKTNAWRKQWYVKATYEPYILIVHPFRNDRLLYYTYEGYLMQMTFPLTDNGAPPTIHSHFCYGGQYRFVDFLYPWCHHLAVTDDHHELTILERYSGTEVSRMELDMEGAASAQVSHPDEPSMVVVSDQGEMTILGLSDPEQPVVLAYFRLQRKPLDLVKFSHSGKFLIAAQRETGNCYFISRQCNDQPWYSVVAQLRLNEPFVDVMVIQDEEKTRLRVLVLLVECRRFNVAAGQRCLVYDVPLDLSLEPKTIGVVTLPGLYYDLCRVPGDHPGDNLLASPYLKRQLHVLKLEEEAISIDAALTCGHHVRLFRAFADRRWIATCAYDGLIVVRDETVSRVVTVVPAHHRLDSGTRKAIVSPEGDTVIALGHDGSLVAIHVSHAGKKSAMSIVSSIGIDDVYKLDNTWYEMQKKTILADYVSLDPAIRASLTRESRQECPAADETRTWEELQEDARQQKERELYAAEKTAIRKDLSDLRTTLRQLVDANETHPEIEKLPVSAFDPDEIGRARKLEAAENEREDFRAELERRCASMDRVANWIRTTFWDPQIVLGRSIFSFRGDIEVTNYPTVQGDPHFEDHLRWARFAKDTESHLVDRGFQPWRRYTDDQLSAILSARVRVRHDDVHEKRRMHAFLEEEDRGAEPDSEETEARKLDGMTTHRFVERSPYYYSQMETYGFAHATLEDCYLMHDCNRLRAYFNKLFDDVYAAKKREMSVIRERNEKIRHIDSELRVMFGQTVPRIPSDPRLHFKEEAESIIEVLDHEIEARPYVSPSQQEILDRRAAERDRIERQSLADDFRERALMRMMDGVLEVRWENTIKQDVRKPTCMLEKQPTQYTHEDIAAVRKYEADVEVLRQERERYRRILEADYARIHGLLQDGIEKFDANLNEFFRLKLIVDAAINQLKLRHTRGRLRNLARVEAVRKDEELMKKIIEKRRYKTALEEHTQNLQNVYQDMLAQQDSLLAREKATVKKHHQEFSGLSKIAVEHLERQYKRRPRIFPKSVTADDLIDLAKLITDRIKPAYLPFECAEYARILEIVIDARPDELPQSIGASHWDHFVRSRRQKIELELRIRAKQLEITAAERTIAVHVGEIEVCESRVDLLGTELKRSRDERMTREEPDAEIQLVLKMGQVEMKLWGDLRDVVNGILVPRREIERVNEHIVVAGARKLDSLKRTIDFRHGTLMLDWEHLCLKTRFQELREDLRLLQDITVTWDLRVCLKRRARGLRDDKTALQLEREIEATQRGLEKTLSKRTDKLRELSRRIVRLKRKNARLDRTVAEMNVTRWELEHRRDIARETREREHLDRRMRMLRRRSDLVKRLQENYVELLALQTESELLRLRKYPTFYYADAEKSVADLLHV